MTSEAIWRLERYLGRPLCGLLTLHRRLSETAAERRAAREPARRILLVKLIEQGATVLAYDAIRRAAALVGRENLYFCVLADNRPILDAMDVIPPENVLVIRNEGFLTFVRDAWQAIRRARQAAIDTVIDMEFLSRASAILAYLTGASRRVGLHRFNDEASYRGDLMTHRILYNPFLHTAQTYSSLIAALAADPDDPPLLKLAIAPAAEPAPRFVPTPADTARLRALLDAAAGHPVRPPLVLLNPNAGDMIPLRRWPLDRFEELARRIVAEHPTATVVLTGAAVEEAAAAALCRAIDSPRLVNLAGRTTMRDVLTLYALADVLVTNDSGPGHFASMTDIENIVLFGPAAPSQFGPVRGRAHVLWAGLACSPCTNPYNHRISPCTNNLCMQAISVDEVYAAVRECLDARAPRAAAPLDAPAASRAG